MQRYRLGVGVVDVSKEHRIINEWRRFLTWTSTRNTVNWMFRGQSCENWPLLPKVGRNESHRFNYTVNSEFTMLQTFKKSAIAHLHGQHLPRSDLQWMVLAQHHGLPTRLLDWTKSPFIAAFFALQNDRDDSQCAVVYAIDVRRQILFDETPLDPFEIPIVSKIVPSIVSDRIVAQQGILTIHPKPNEPIQPRNKKRFSKHVFPKDLKKELKTKLVNIGVNWHSLFLNLEGLSDHITFMNRILAPDEREFNWEAVFESSLSAYRQRKNALPEIESEIRERKTIGDLHGEQFYKRLKQHLIRGQDKEA